MQQLKSIQNLQKIHTIFNHIYEWLYDQKQGSVHTDKLFDSWTVAKKRFYDAWGGNLIWEYPKKVSFDLSEREREQRLDEFIAHIYDDLSCDLANFLEKNKKGIYENKLTSDEWIDTHGVLHAFPHNIKLSRAILQLASKEKVCSTAEAEFVRCCVAELIQETKITGRLCFSVHPLDYISISENQANWRSCHALDGEFASGNLSYMMDKYTVVAYLRSERLEQLPRFPEDVPWNSKKWRMLICFDDKHQIVWANRQYPFYSKSALALVADIINDNVREWKFFDKNFSVNNWQYCMYEDGKRYKFETTSFKQFKHARADRIFQLDRPWMFYENNMIPVEDLVGNVPESFNFNDLTDSSTYVPDFMPYSVYPYHLELNDARAKGKMLIGGIPNCIFCDDQPIAYTSIPVCPDCLIESKIETEYITYCTCCGKRLLADDCKYDCGDPYCDDCYERLDN